MLLLVLPATMLFSLVTPVFQLNAQAQAENLTAQLRREARLYTVSNALVACFQDQTGNGLKPETTTNNLSSELPVFTGQDITVGHHVKPSDGKADCSSASWTASAVDMVGITSHTEFMEMFYAKTGSGNFWELKLEVARGDTNTINTFLKKSSENGNTMVACTARQGCTVTPLSDAARYVLYLENLKKGCGATVVSGSADDLNSIDEDHKATIKIVNDQGTPVDQTYKLEQGKGKFISVGQGVTSDGNLTCGTLIEQINKLAPAFIERVEQAKRDGQSIGDVDGATAAAGSTDADNNPSCETTKNPMSWILCPIINGIAELADFVFQNLIQPLLVSRDIGYTNTTSGIYRAWSSFRTIANILLILALLVIVFGQAIGGGIVDAYTAKKALPRLFAAAILINISIYLVAFALDITNIIGAGISNIIYAPFQGAGEFKIQLGNVSSGGLLVGLFGAGAAIWAAGSAITSVLPWIGLFVVLPAVLAFLGVLVTLVIRQGIIIMLVLVSPLAFLAFVLPNTERYFKQWWNLLLKTLLVYPIVMVIFAVADVLASVLSGSFPLAVQWLADVISIVLLILPLFLVPFAFKLAGGAIGSLYATLSGASKRGTELLKGSERDPLSMRNRAKFKARSGLNDANMAGNALGTRLNPFVRGDRRRSRLTAIRDTNQAILGTDTAQAALLQATSQDDKPMTDLALFGSSTDSRAAIDAEVLQSMHQAQADLTSGTITQAQYQARLSEINATKNQKLAASATADRIGRTSANRRFALMQGSTISYGLAPGKEGWDTAVGAMRDIAGGDETQLRSMVNQFQYVAKGSGRADLSGNTDSGEYNGDRAWKSVGLYQHSNSKPADIVGSGRHYLEKFQTGNAEDKDDAAVFYKELQGMVNGSTGGVRDAIEQQMALLEQAGISQHLGQVFETKQVMKPNPNNRNVMIPTDVSVTREQALLAGDIKYNKDVKQADGTTINIPVTKRVRTYERPDINRINEEEN